MKKILFFLGAFLLPFFAYTQTADSFYGLIKSGPEDTYKLSSAYLNPFFKGVGLGLNSAWNTSAEVKKPGRFDIRIGASLSMANAGGQRFDAAALGLSDNIKITSENSTSPTVLGNEGPAARLAVFDDQGNELENFSLPGGLGIHFVPVPQVQATVGLPLHTDVSVRYSPEIRIGNKYGRIGTWGFGLRHDLMKDIFGTKTGGRIPFDLAVAFAYSQLNYHLDLDIQPVNNSQPVNAQQNSDFSSQRISGRVSAINLEVILSKKLLFFTPFVSAGWNTARTNVGLLGNYPIITDADLLGNTRYTTFTDPVKIQQNAYTAFRATAGFQLNLAFFRIYGAYSVSEYPTALAGIGFGI
ncbi:MAG: hypothetical protein INR69_02600 [Mucilaginibacter polytrichastri]|nr:hypothetical protein [Mucilaginibacter polytrichastri]